MKTKLPLFRKESEFLMFIRKLLEGKGHIPLPQNSFLDPRRQSRYIPGTPDLIVCAKDGRFIGLELKLKGNGLQPSQKEMQRRFEFLGLSDCYRVIYPENYETELEDLL